MKTFLLMAVILVVVMVGMKACSSGVAAMKGGLENTFAGRGKVGDGVPKTVVPQSAPAKEGEKPQGKAGAGYVLYAEKFRGFLGLTGSLRTDLGQYTPGSLSHHGLVLRTNDREALIKGTAGLVVVVAVDDYTRPEAPPEPAVDAKAAAAFIGAERAPVVNASPAAAVPVKTATIEATPMKDVPREESLKLTRQQQRQAQRGVLVKGPFKSELRMGP